MRSENDADLWYKISNPQLGRTVVCFPPLAACIAPSGMMEASFQGGVFQASSSLLCAVAEEHGVSNSRD